MREGPLAVKKFGHCSNSSLSTACAYRACSLSTSRWRSDIHVRAPGLPQPAHRSLGDAGVAGADDVAAHLDYGRALARGGDATLHEAGGGTVLHRDVARRADEVRLQEAPAKHRFVVVGETEQRPVQLGAVDALRHHLPRGERVADLVQDEAGEERQDL